MTKAEIIAVKALHSKEGRNEQGLFLCEGAKLVDEIVRSELRVRSVMSTSTEILESIAPSTTCERVSPTEMSRISALKTPTQVLAVVEIPHYEQSYLGLNLVLDGVQDPGNIGTIIRLADWFGIRNIYCSPNSADCFNPKVVQATMGAIARVRVHYADLAELLERYSGPIYGTFLEGGENIYNANLTPNEGMIVMGSEGRGVSPEVARLISQKLFIPPFPPDQATTESLNVAVATSIICSEFRRRA